MAVGPSNKGSGRLKRTTIDPRIGGTKGDAGPAGKAGAKGLGTAGGARSRTKIDPRIGGQKGDAGPAGKAKSLSGFGKALTQVYTGEVTTAAVSEYAKTEYGFEPTGMNEDVTHLSSTPVIKDDARSRVQSLDANSVSDVSDDEVLAQLQNIISKGSTKDAIRAKLTLMENAKNES